MTRARWRSVVGVPPPPPPVEVLHGHGRVSQAIPSPSESSACGSLCGPPAEMKKFCAAACELKSPQSRSLKAAACEEEPTARPAIASSSVIMRASTRDSRVMAANVGPSVGPRRGTRGSWSERTSRRDRSAQGAPPGLHLARVVPGPVVTRATPGSQRSSSRRRTTSSSTTSSASPAAHGTKRTAGAVPAAREHPRRRSPTSCESSAGATGSHDASLTAPRPSRVVCLRQSYSRT